MDETTRFNAQDPTVLSPEEIALLVKYAEALIIEEGAQAPEAAADLPTLTCAAPPELVENIYRLQPEKRLIVVTRTQMAADLAQVLSRSITSNHFALCADGKWDAKPALDEISRLDSTLTDDDDTLLVIQSEVIPGIYASEDGRLLAKGDCLSELGGKRLFGKHFHDAWGTLLPEQYNQKTLADDTLDFTTRTFAIANLLVQMKKRSDGKVPVPENTMVFDSGKCLVTEWETPADRDEAVRRVFFLLLFGAEERSDALASMLPMLADAEDVPDAFLSDLERIYVNGAACSFRKWNNILERLMLDYEEMGILKGGAAE